MCRGRTGEGRGCTTSHSQGLKRLSQSKKRHFRGIEGGICFKTEKTRLAVMFMPDCRVEYRKLREEKLEKPSGTPIGLFEFSENGFTRHQSNEKGGQKTGEA